VSHAQDKFVVAEAEVAQGRVINHGMTVRHIMGGPRKIARLVWNVAL
jgi:hypothetical protein